MAGDAVTLGVEGITGQVEKFTALLDGINLRTYIATHVGGIFLHHLQGNAEDNHDKCCICLLIKSPELELTLLDTSV